MVAAMPLPIVSGLIFAQHTGNGGATRPLFEAAAQHPHTLAKRFERIQ